MTSSWHEKSPLFEATWHRMSLDSWSDIDIRQQLTTPDETWEWIDDKFDCWSPKHVIIKQETLFVRDKPRERKLCWLKHFTSRWARKRKIIKINLHIEAVSQWNVFLSHAFSLNLETFLDVLLCSFMTTRVQWTIVSLVRKDGVKRRTISDLCQDHLGCSNSLWAAVSEPN